MKARHPLKPTGPRSWPTRRGNGCARNPRRTARSSPPSTAITWISSTWGQTGKELSMRFAIVLVAASLLAATADDEALFRTQREARLKAPDGWLAVAGLFWLHEGANVVGSDAKSDVVLPAGAPVRAAVLRVTGGKVTLEPE